MRELIEKEIKKIFENLDIIKESLKRDKEKICKISLEIVNRLKNGKKVLIFGNGGSASQAQHFSAEMVGRYGFEREGYPVIALTTDSSILTAISNDYDYDKVFQRQVNALGKEGDLVIGLSTSGKSKNVFNALIEAKKKGIKSVALLGKDGGTIKDIADISIIFECPDTPRIQEYHEICLHLIAYVVENMMAMEESNV